MFKLWERYDFKKYRWSILVIIIILCSLGIYVLGKVQGEDINMVPKQIKGLIAGIIGAMIISLFDYHFISKFAILMYLVNLGLLFIVKYVEPLNVARGGVNRWIGIPNDKPNRWFEFQASELSKVILVICLAVLFDKLMGKMKQIYVLLLALGILIVPVLLVFLQPDLSTTIVICVSLVVIIFASGLSYKLLMPIVLVAVPLFMGLFWYVQQDFQALLTKKQQLRVLSLLHPEIYADEIYQQENSIIAISSGKIAGKFFDGTTTLGAKNIPVVESDFIFSGMAEAFGFLGSCVIILLILALSFECFFVAKKSGDLLGRLIALGVGTTYIFQAFVNIGVVTMLLPNTGIPLPFVSYGLSSLLCNMIGIGIVLNIGIVRKKPQGQVLDLEFSTLERKGDL